MSPFTLMLAQKGTQCFYLFNRQINPDKLFLYQLLIKVRTLVSHHENSEYCIAHYNQLRCKYCLKMCLIQGRHCIFHGIIVYTVCTDSTCAFLFLVVTCTVGLGDNLFTQTLMFLCLVGILQSDIQNQIVLR